MAEKRRKLTHQLIEQCQKRFDAGEAGALLDAVDLCARSGTVLPLWAAEAFCDNYSRWAMFKDASLDDAFGVKRRKRMRIKDRAHREWLRPRVVLLVQKLKAEGRAIDEGMFEAIGKELKISSALAKFVYYDPATATWRKLLNKVKITEKYEPSN